MDLSDFFSAYPDYTLNKYDLLNPFEGTMYNSLNNLKEFTVLPENEDKPKYSGIPLIHQRNISHFLSPLTPFDKLLLIHQVGTGKTCSSVQIAELCKALRPDLGKCLVILSNEALMEDFKNQLIKTCTDGRYIPENSEDLTADTYTRRRNVILAKRYEFYTREKFAANYLHNTTLEEIKKIYSNRVIIIDEAHHLKDQPKKKKKAIGQPSVDIYKEFWKFTHVVENCKIVLLSGTPARDNPREFASLMNIILPLKEQLPYATFNEEFFLNGKIIEEKKKILYKAFHGRISYLRKMEGNIKVINEPSQKTIDSFEDQRDVNEDQEESDVKGENEDQRDELLDPYPETSEGKLNKIRVMALKMKPFQANIYKQAYTEDTTKGKRKGARSLFFNSVQASNFCYPDNIDYIDDPNNATGSWGSKGFNKYFEEHKGKYTIKKSLEKLMLYKTNEVKTKQDKQDVILNNIKQCSIKMGETIEIILNNKDQLSFVYIEQVTGSGSVLFTALLQLFDYLKFRPGRNKKQLLKTIDEEKEKKYRFAFIDGKTSKAEIDNIINIFNTKDNLEKKYISAIVGSQVISEGYSFHNINNTFIVSPHWNNSITEQAIGRTNRAFSHYPELKLKELHIYRMASVFLGSSGSKKKSNSSNNSKTNSIDLIMYKRSEDKDILIMQIMRLIKESAFDCQLNRKRNIKSTDIPGSRDCDYMDDCNYKCRECTFYEREKESKREEKQFTWGCKDVNQINNEDKNSTNFNLYFAEGEIIVIKEMIKELYKINFIYDLEQIVSFLKERFNFMIILRSLKELIDQSVVIKNKYGFSCYLRENNNLYFLVDNITYPNNFDIVYYVKNPATKELLNFSIILDQVKIKYLYNTLDYLENLEVPDNKDQKVIYTENVKKEIQILPINIQELFLEKAIVGVSNEKKGEEKKISKNQKMIRKIIIDLFKPITIENDRMFISKLLYPQHLRCFEKKELKWNQCDDLLVELKDIENEKNIQIQQDRSQIVQRAFETVKYYGVIYNGKFHIRTVESRIMFEGRESKNKTTGKKVGKGSEEKGRNCNSYKIAELIYILILTDYDPPESYENIEDNKELLKLIKRNKKYSEVKKLISDKSNHKKIGIDNVLLIEDMNNKQLNIFNYIIIKTKEDLCKILQKQYEKLDLIDEKNEDKKKKKE